MSDERDIVDEMTSKIIGGSQAAAVDPTVWIGFIQTIIQAIQECRANRAKRIARRAKRGRRADIARLAVRLEDCVRDDQDPTLIRKQAIELAERTFAEAAIDPGRTIEAIEELQDAGEPW